MIETYNKEITIVRLKFTEKLKLLLGFKLNGFRIRLK